MSNDLKDVALVVQQTTASSEPCQHYITNTLKLRIRSWLNYAKTPQQLAQWIEEPTTWLLEQWEYLAQHEPFVHASKAIDVRPVQQQANEASPIGVYVRGHEADLPRMVRKPQRLQIPRDCINALSGSLNQLSMLQSEREQHKPN